jgi:hypothetical protein
MTPIDRAGNPVPGTRPILKKGRVPGIISRPKYKLRYYVFYQTYQRINLHIYNLN